MKSKIKRKTLALVLAISMILMSLPISGIAVAGENNTAPIIDFTNAAPIFEAPAVTPYVARRSMFASPAQTFALTRGVQKDATGLELSKTATDNGDGTYTITLEAYTTGTVTVTQTTKPLDIVLVLDQSGSMEWCINCGAENWREDSTCSKAPEAYIPVSVTDLNNNGEYYVKSGNTYTRVYYCDRASCLGWFTEQHHDGFIFIGPSHEGTQVDPTEVQFYEHTGGKHVRRVDALKEAVQTFVDEVYRKAAGADGKHGTDDDVAHRIAIVGFGSNNSNNTELLSITGTNNTVAGTSKKVGVQYSTNLSAQQYKDVLQNLGKDSYANSKAMLDNAIKVLAASGATQADLGMKMAEKAGLPPIIKNFILTHHGHGVTKYFYIKEQNEHPDEEIDKTPFTYPGTNPFTREQAIVMMADAVEAASRSLSEYTEESITNMVNRIIDSQLNEGFFRSCPITFRDIELAKQVLIGRLKNIYHTRISYPELQKSEEEETTESVAEEK